MEICTGTEYDREYCQVEKRGCSGCRHYKQRKGENHMKIKNVNLKWNVLRHDFNKNKIIPYNILGYSFAEDLAKDIKKQKIENREQLKEHLKREFMYHYWSKSECEIAMGGLHTNYSEEDLEKIDMWYQIEMNFDNIIDYIILKMKLFEKKGK